MRAIITGFKFAGRSLHCGDGSELFGAAILLASVVMGFLPCFRSFGFTRLPQWLSIFRLVTPDAEIRKGGEGGGECPVFHNDAFLHGRVPACPY